MFLQFIIFRFAFDKFAHLFCFFPLLSFSLSFVFRRFSGKKGKKSKGKTLNLQDFLSENGAPPTSSVVTKSLSWANECEDDDYSPPKILTYAIPTAPRSQRVLDDSTIPTSPPFSAHISNLPYDLNETDIQEYFESVTNSVVLSVRLPREDGDSGRMRGFGYIEFGDRDGLIAAVSQPELTLRNRKIRIDVSTENDSKRGGNRRYDNFGASDNRDSNWRRGQGQDSNDSSSRRSDVENDGNWRSGDRPKRESPPPARRAYGRRNNDFDDRNRRDDDRAPLSEERPRIKLNPRTLPLPELQIDEREREQERETPKPEAIKPRPKPVPSAAIFGAAKPVDTAAKDREIEARLEKERERIQQEAELAEKEKSENEAKAEIEEEDNATTTPVESEGILHENGNDEHHDNDNESGTSADKAPADKTEIISWRRKPEDDAQGEEQQDQERHSHSPTRKRYSPDRRRRQHPGKFSRLP